MRSSFFLFFGGVSVIATGTNSKDMQINEEIRDPQIRLVGESGGQLGIMSAKEAQKLALEQGLDLVKIAPQADPPVCRLMDYGKYCFEQQKREKEARKNQKVVDVKEIQLTLNIEQHDFETKVNRARRFLQDGDKVKIMVKFRSREVFHPEWGTEMMERVTEGVQDIGIVDKDAKLNGRNMIMIIAPKPVKPEKGQSKAKEQPKEATEETK